jgi:hypothetical protein
MMSTQTIEKTGMKRPASGYVTLVEVLELTSSFEEFQAAIRAAARRLEAERVRELVTLQFYATPGATARARTPHLLRSRPDRGAFRHDHGVGRVRAVLRNGEVSQFDVVSKTFEEHVAGFVR